MLVLLKIVCGLDLQQDFGNAPEIDHYHLNIL